MLWYPIKERAACDALARRLKKLDIPNMLRCELDVGPSGRGERLLGSGLIVVNPPFTLPSELQTLLPVLGRTLSFAPIIRTDWLAPERRAGRGQQ